MNYIANESRYGTMIYKKCGDSGLKLPIISLGLWHNFGSNADYDVMKQLCYTAFDNGITQFDLANNYGPVPGSAESNFGKILHNELLSYRDEMIITTKAGFEMWDGPYGDGGSRKYLIASLEQSLKRLNVSYVDIFYHHRPDTETPLEETMEALNFIVKSGKALYVGLSNYDGPTMLEATEILDRFRCPYIINQNKYSMLDKTIEENGLLESSVSKGKGIIAFSPLAQGLLSDKYINSIPQDSRMKTDGRFLKEDSINQKVIGKITALNKVASMRGQTLAQMALSYLAQKDAITSVLIGASKPAQIVENIRAMEQLEFDEEELALIHNILIENL